MTDTKTPQAPREEEKLLEELEKQMATDHRRECPKGIWKAQKYLERLERFYMGSIPTLISHIRSLRFKLEASERKNLPHMCRDGHEEIRHKNSEHERCIVCRLKYQLEASEREAKLGNIPYKEAVRLQEENVIFRRAIGKFKDEIRFANGNKETILECSKECERYEREILSSLPTL